MEEEKKKKKELYICLQSEMLTMGSNNTRRALPAWSAAAARAHALNKGALYSGGVSMGYEERSTRHLH